MRKKGGFRSSLQNFSLRYSNSIKQSGHLKAGSGFISDRLFSFTALLENAWHRGPKTHRLKPSPRARSTP